MKEPAARRSELSCGADYMAATNDVNRPAAVLYLGSRALIYTRYIFENVNFCGWWWCGSYRRD